MDAAVGSKEVSTGTGPWVVALFANLSDCRRMTDRPDLTPEQREMMVDATNLAASDMTIVENGALRTHPASACHGRHCWIHDPTPSHMTSWPVRWRGDKGTAERICKHGIGHPDIDDVNYNLSIRRDVTQHGCDGCCAARNE